MVTNMSEPNLTEILTKASQSENTPELQNYWKRRYEDIISKNLFVLNPKTINLVTTEAEVVKPATTFGEILLMSHLDRNLVLDESMLQNTIESAVRLLDGLLDQINFTPEAESIVKQYRKIGLGIADFDRYIESKNPVSKIDEIDWLGNLISSAAYRSSESLAEEKGVCLGWDKIKKHLRPKSFEYWFNQTGEIRNGLEMTEDWDNISIVNSNYEIVPRRNSHLLVYPPDLEWQIWADRDESSPATEIRAEAKTVEGGLSTKKPAESGSKVVESPSTESSSPADKSTDSSLSSRPFIPDPEVLQGVAPTLATPIATTSETVPAKTAPIYSDSKTPSKPTTEPVTEPMSNLPKTTEKVDQTVAESDQPNSVATDFGAINLGSEKNSRQLEEPAFQVGELVQIGDPKSDYYGKVFQVVELEEEPQLHYKLIGGDENLENIQWRQDQLRSVELLEILDKLNLPNLEPETTEPISDPKLPKVKVAAISLNDQGQIWLDHHHHLPSQELPYNAIPEQFLVDYLNRGFGLQAKILEEVGSSVSFHQKNSDSPFTVYLGYLVELSPASNLESRSVAKSDQSAPTYLNPSQVSDLPNYARVLLNKLNRRRISNSNLQKKVNELEKALAQANLLAKSYQTELDKLQAGQSKSEANNLSPKASTLANPVNLNYSSFNSKNNSLKSKTMSKYALKLEQLVQTNAFGDMTVTIQYDSQGPKVVSATGHKLSPELRHLLDTVLVLVNFALTKGIRPNEISEQLQKEPNDGIHLPINDLLKVIAISLEQAPSGVDKINPDILTDIIPEVIQAAENQTSKTDRSPVSQPFQGDQADRLTQNGNIQNQSKMEHSQESPNRNQDHSQVSSPRN
jgi:hypothetical protein